jgi:hypothetical protein
MGLSTLVVTNGDSLAQTYLWWHYQPEWRQMVIL